MSVIVVLAVYNCGPFLISENVGEGSWIMVLQVSVLIELIQSILLSVHFWSSSRAIAECVTTHGPNELALKMDGAQMSDRLAIRSPRIDSASSVVKFRYRAAEIRQQPPSFFVLYISSKSRPLRSAFNVCVVPIISSIEATLST